LPVPMDDPMDVDSPVNPPTGGLIRRRKTRRPVPKRGRETRRDRRYRK